MKYTNYNNFEVRKSIEKKQIASMKLNTVLLKGIFLFSLILIADVALAQVGMRNFTGNLGGSSGGSGGGAGVPIDGGLVAAIAGSAGYAYKKLKHKN
jgi:hypothetical protein